MLDWQALVGTEQPGVYQTGQPISATDPATLQVYQQGQEMTMVHALLQEQAA